MDHFEKFIREKENPGFIRIHEIESFVQTISDQDDKYDFYMKLQKHIIEIDQKNHPGVDAARMSTYGNNKLLQFIEAEKTKIENQNYFNLKDDEQIPGSILSRKQHSLLAHYLRELGIFPRYSNYQLAEKYSNLTGVSKQNMRTDLSINNLEIIMEEPETKELENLLTKMLNQIRAKKLK